MTASQIVTFLIFWLSTQDEYISVFILENAVINLIIPCILLVAELYFHIAYSGIPFLSIKLKDRVSALNGVIFFWAIGRIIQGTVGIIAFSMDGPIIYFVQSVQESTGNNYLEDLLIPASFLFDAFVCEIIPLFLILDSKKLDLFFLNSEISNYSIKERLIDDEINFDNIEEQEKVTTKKEISLQNTKLSEDKEISESATSRKASFDVPRLLINSKDKNMSIDNNLVICFLYHC